jgi:hypothetical protein
MAVRVFCDEPATLLKNVRAAIRNDKIDTWELDGDGDLTHSPQQWRNLAWFHPSVRDGQIVFYIIGQKSKAMSKVVYGVYHGRLIEMFLSHFDTDFSSAVATSLPIDGDRVGASS